MQIPAPLHQLIHAIYQGVMEVEHWRGFLVQLNTLFEADVAMIAVQAKRQPGNRFLLSRVVNHDTVLNETASHWMALDPFQNIADASPTLLDELDTHSEIERSSLFRELIAPTGIRYIVALNVPGDADTDLVLKLRLGRAQARGNFSAAQCELLASLVTHLQLALGFLDRMAIRQIERNAFADAINQFMLGTLIVDRAGHVVASNRVARDTLARYPQLGLRNGVLTLSDAKAQQKLARALAALGESRPRDALVPSTLTLKVDDGRMLGLMIRPPREEDALAHPAHAHAVIFISDPGGTCEVSAKTLRDLFGLTSGEAKVAAWLANGHSLTEAACALSISINTAKSHARSIYEKTGVNKQTKLIQLIANSVARVS